MRPAEGWRSRCRETRGGGTGRDWGDPGAWGSSEGRKRDVERPGDTTSDVTLSGPPVAGTDLDDHRDEDPPTAL